MMYDVHIFAVVLLKVESIEADTQKDAIWKALESVDLYNQFEGPHTEYAEEIVRYVVDEVGEDEYSHTQTYLDKYHQESHALDEESGVEIIDSEN
jgi:hypothetical protein